jgi:hypothetical protein
MWLGEMQDYFTIVEKPMDLGTIRNRLEKGEAYRTVEEVFEDVALVWSNCRMYNAKGDPILEFLSAVEATFSTLCLAAGFLFPSSAPGPSPLAFVIYGYICRVR